MELYEELIILRNIINENSTTLDISSLLKKMMSSFSNTCNALRIILIISVTSATTERRFSKFQFLNNYLRSIAIFTYLSCKMVRFK